MDTIFSQVTFSLTFIGVALLALRRSVAVKNHADFALAGRSLPATGVAWIIIGTLVGGVATIGTVQTAYTQGISACIFTFGSGVSCLLLGCFFARALREEGVVTVSEYLGRRFGQPFRRYSSAVSAFGMFIHVVGQLLAAIAILQAVFGLADLVSVALAAALIGIFVVSGGIAGAGLIGKIKCFMLYLVMLASAGVALVRGGGWMRIVDNLPPEANLLSFADYGVSTAVWDTISMLVGVLSTQIYLQAIFAARDVRAARNGAFLSAAVIPPLGALGIVVGLYLRAYYPELGGSAAQALPFFLTISFPPMVAAFFNAGILLIVLGTGAGLVLGVTTNIYNDFLSQMSIVRQMVQPVRLLRGCALTVLLLASLLVFTGLESTILSWSYLSMGLRGSAVFTGLCVIVFLKRYADSRVLLMLLYLLPVLYLWVKL
ncbi:MAG: sodium:solute symporter family protein [Desulfofustis sp.]|nr:sodium:solute symporter family protein [Desulfofustis sp.]